MTYLTSLFEANARSIIRGTNKLNSRLLQGTLNRFNQPSVT